MPDDSSAHSNGTDTKTPKKLGKTVLDDLNQVDFRRDFRYDLEDVYRYYVDDETRRRLDGMDHVSRWFHLTFWVMKASVLKLVPARRLMLLAGLVFFLIGVLDNLFALILGFLLLLLVLVLELKDKLLAQDELEAGRAVQSALMPKEHPALPGWQAWLFTRPANEVGGDIVDFQRIGEARLGLALADVAGKGLGAALFTARLQSILRALAPTFDSLAELARRINDIFVRDGLPDRFISMIYLEVEPDEGRVRLVNAGHPPPVVVRAEAVEELPRGAPALGLMPNVTYAEQTVTLGPGDVLLVYSDGLTEARNEDGAFFDEERLFRLLPNLRRHSAETIGQRLLNVVAEFSGEARPNDDLSLIVLKRAPTASLPPAAPPAENVRREDVKA